MKSYGKSPAGGRALSLAVACVLYAGTGMPAASAQDAPAAEAPEGRLEEITVTARKREETLQQVPVAIAAFSAEKILETGARDLQDIAQIATGVQFSNQAASIPGRYNCAIRFRGFNVNNEVPFYQVGALFVDGIYVAAGCQALGSEELERVEIIRGPQSAYFGRNTFAGAINYITKNPSFDWGAKVTAQGAERGEYDSTLAVEGPILDDLLSFRVSARAYGRGEQYTATDGGALGQEKSRQATATLYLKPTETSFLRVRGFYGEDRDGAPVAGFLQGNVYDTCTGTTGPGGVARTRYICGAVPKIGDTVSGTRPAGSVTGDGFEYQRTLPAGPFTTTVPSTLISYNTQLNPNAAYAGRGNGAYPFQLLVENVRGERAIADALAIDYMGLKRNVGFVSAQGEYEFGNGWTLAANGAYFRYRANWIRDFDFTDTHGWISNDPQNLTDRNYELRLASGQDQPITWLIGANTYTQEFTQSGNGGTALANTCLRAGATPGSRVCLITTPGAPQGGAVFPNSQVNNVELETTGYFAAASWRISEQWAIDVEGRYQQLELRKGQQAARDAALVGLNLPVLSVEENKFLPRVIVRFEPLPGTNLYASWSKGVLQPDVNAEFFYGTPETRDQIDDIRTQILNGTAARADLGLPGGTSGLPQAAVTVPADELEMFEVGWKQLFWDDRARVNVAIYHGDWSNLKGRVSAPVIDYNAANSTATNRVPLVPDPPECRTIPRPTAAQNPLCNDVLRTFQLTVVGEAKVKGIEVESQLQATDRLLLEANVEYVQAEYGNFIFNFVEALAGTRQMKGNKTPRYPSVKGNVAATWTAPLGSTSWEWFTRWDAIYTGKTYTDESNLAWVEPYWLVNARVGFRKEQLGIEFFVRNLTDEDQWASAARFSDFGIPGNFNFPANQGIVVTPQPERQFGARVSVGF